MPIKLLVNNIVIISEMIGEDDTVIDQDLIFLRKKSDGGWLMDSHHSPLAERSAVFRFENRSTFSPPKLGSQRKKIKANNTRKWPNKSPVASSFERKMFSGSIFFQ